MSEGEINHGSEEATRFIEDVHRLLESPVAVARMLEWLGTAGREPYDTESQSHETRLRSAGLIEVAIVLSKQLCVLLGDDEKVGYPMEELPKILKSIGERFDCLWVVKWALQRSLSPGTVEPGSL